MRKRAAILAALASLGAAALGACSSAPGTLFERSGPDLVWPSPPDEPRVRYVGDLRTTDDLKAGKSFGQGLGEFFFGKDSIYAMLSPMGVCTDGKDRVFVADSNAQTLHVFDLGARTYARWEPPVKEKGAPAYSQPVAVAFDAAAQRVLVADSVAGVIETFALDGTYQGALGSGVLRRPCGVAADAGGRVYAVDVLSHAVIVFDRAGTQVAQIGSRGSELGQFNYPTNIAIAPDGRLFVTDTLNFRVQVLQPDGTPIRQIGRKGDLPGYFSQPKGVAIGPDSIAFVVDANFEAVQMFDADAQLLMSFGREGHGPGEFWLPAGICVDPSGRVFVADSYNKRIQVFQLVRSMP